MEASAQNWAVVTQTPDPGKAAFLSEILNFADLGPALLLVLLAGVIADRVNTRRWLLVLQCAACLLGAGLALTAYLGWASPWVVIWFTAAEGIVWALNGPPWISVVPRLVPREELPTAIAANSAQFNLARLLGPFIAGIVIARVSIAAAFTVNALTFIPVFYALWRLPNEPAPATPVARRPLLEDLGTGLKIVATHKGLRRLSIMSITFMFLIAPLQGLLAIYVRTVIPGGESSLYGTLLGGIGLGAFVGALTITRIPAYYPRHHLIPIAMALAAAATVAFSFTTWPPACFAIIAVVGYFFMLSLNSANAANQLLASDASRGRVMSVMLLCNQGAAPLGHLFAAGLTHLMSPPMVIRSMAGTLLIIALYYVMRREPAIDAMEPLSRKPGVWAAIVEALTAQSHRRVPTAVQEQIAQQPGTPSDITPHAN